MRAICKLLQWRDSEIAYGNICISGYLNIFFISEVSMSAVGLPVVGNARAKLMKEGHS